LIIDFAITSQYSNIKEEGNENYFFMNNVEDMYFQVTYGDPATSACKFSYPNKTDKNNQM
jgi:small-conductance mechanosensitive channel